MMRNVAAVLAVLLASLSVSVAVAPVVSVLVGSLIGSRLSVVGSGPGLAHLGSIPASGQPLLAGPTGVAVDENEHIYVADPTLGEIRVYGYDGRQLLSFHELGGSGPKRLEAPVDVKLNGPDEVLVTDRKLRALVVFSRTGEYRGKFVPPSRGWSPLGVAVAPDGTVYVTDVGDPAHHMVRAFSQSGMPLFSFGQTAEVGDRAQSPGTFYYPSRILADEDSVFVADSDNGRVQVFDRNGNFRRFILTGGVPRGLALDAKGRLLVADALGSRVTIYGADGTAVDSLGSAGDFKFPNDLAIDHEGRVYVADRASSSVQVWGTSDQRYLPASSSLRSVRWPWLLPAVALLALLPVLWRRLPEDVQAADDVEQVA